MGFVPEVIEIEICPPESPTTELPVSVSAYHQLLRAYHQRCAELVKRTVETEPSGPQRGQPQYTSGPT